MDRWPNDDAQKWFSAKISELEIKESAPKPLFLGRHLIEMGFEPSPVFGQIIEEVYQSQLDGRVEDLDQACELARNLLAKSLE